jgi:TPR repeat protein
MKKDNQEQEKPNAKMTIDELTALAEQGHDFTQYNLALCYWDGEGVEKDFKQAIKWFKKAANQGDTEAQKDLDDLKQSLEYFNLRYTHHSSWHKSNSDTDCPF